MQAQAEEKRKKEVGGAVSGENKPFAALIESLSLAAARPCQGKCLFTARPLWELFFYQLFNVIKLGDKII